MAEDKKTPAVKAALYSIAKGKSITSKKGILGPSDEVKADFLIGGDATLQKLVKSGHVVKAK